MVHNQELKENERGHANSLDRFSTGTRTKPPRQTRGTKRSLDHPAESLDPSPKIHRPREVSRSPFSSNSSGLSGSGCKPVRDAIEKVLRDEIALEDFKTTGPHGSIPCHVQCREDQKPSAHIVFNQKWYDGLQVGSTAKNRFRVPENVLMPSYFAIDDHLHNSLFCSGAESEEANSLYQVLAFVQNVSNELLCMMKAAKGADDQYFASGNGLRKNMMEIWKKIRGISEMLETRYDLLQFRKRGHKVQAKMLESYCVPQLGGSLLARTVFREIQNVPNGDSPVISAEFARMKATQSNHLDSLKVPRDKHDDDGQSPSPSRRHTQIKEDRSGGNSCDVSVVDGKTGRKCTTPNSNIDIAKNKSGEVIGKDRKLVCVEDPKKITYRETQTQKPEMIVNHGLTRVPVRVESNPIRTLTIPEGSQIFVERVQKDELGSIVMVPRRAEWQNVKVIPISDERDAGGSNVVQELARPQRRSRDSNSPETLSLVRVNDKTFEKQRPLPPPKKVLRAFTDDRRRAQMQCVSTLLSTGKTIAFTYVLGEEQRRAKRSLVACPCWGGFKWALLIFPNGDQKRDVLAVFVKCLGRENGENNAQWKAEAKFGICVAERSSSIYASALGGAKDASVVNNACHEVLALLKNEKEGKINERYFGRSQHVFRSHCNNRGFPMLAPTSELRTPMFCNEEKKMVLVAYISAVKDLEK